MVHCKKVLEKLCIAYKKEGQGDIPDWGQMHGWAVGGLESFVSRIRMIP